MRVTGPREENESRFGTVPGIETKCYIISSTVAQGENANAYGAHVHPAGLVYV
jgi:hypothetical protein